MKKLVKTDAEWAKELSPFAYKVTRKGGTEGAFLHANFPARPGRFHCVRCYALLIANNAQFDSGTGWPSFFQPRDEFAITERDDRKLFVKRTEVICSRCDAHLGHVFPDGPPPTGQRYCINGVALRFRSS